MASDRNDPELQIHCPECTFLNSVNNYTCTVCSAYLDRCFTPNSFDRTDAFKFNDEINTRTISPPQQSPLPSTSTTTTTTEFSTTQSVPTDNFSFRQNDGLNQQTHNNNSLDTVNNINDNNNINYSINTNNSYNPYNVNNHNNENDPFPSQIAIDSIPSNNFNNFNTFNNLNNLNNNNNNFGIIAPNANNAHNINNNMCIASNNTLHISNNLNNNNNVLPNNDHDGHGFAQSLADALVACGGECGALFPKLLKEIREISHSNQLFNNLVVNNNNINTIRDHFCTHESPCRRSLLYNIEKLNRQQRNEYFTAPNYLNIGGIGGTTQFCENFYKNLENGAFLIYLDNDVEDLLNFLRILSINNAFMLLSKLANVTCEFGERSLMEECKQNLKADGLQPLVWRKIVMAVGDIMQNKQVYKETLRKGYGMTSEEVMAIYVYCHDGKMSNSIRTSHRLSNTCKWKKMYQSICSGVYKLSCANYSESQITSINQQDSLYHGCTVIDPDVQMPFNLHTITSFTEDFRTAVGFHQTGNNGNGVILQLSNVSTALKNGTLIAAKVQDFSPFAHEKEWIVLPVTLTAKQVIINNQYNPNITSLNWTRIQQITQYSSVDISHVSNDMDEISKPLMAHFDDKEREQVTRRYHVSLITLGMFYKLQCWLCHRWYRLLDYGGDFFAGDLRCPCCLSIQFGGLQRPNELIECKNLKCGQSSPRRTYTFDGCVNEKDGKLCPLCKEPTIKSLRDYQKYSKEFSDWLDNACDNMPETLSEFNLQIGLEPTKLKQTVMKNIDNENYRLDDFLTDHGSVFSRMVKVSLSKTICDALAETFAKNGNQPLTLDSEIDVAKLRLRFKISELKTFLKFQDNNSKLRDPYTMVKNYGNFIKFIPEIVYYNKIIANKAKYYKKYGNNNNNDDIDERDVEFEKMKDVIEGILMPLLVAPDNYKRKTHLTIGNVLKLYNHKLIPKDENLDDEKMRDIENEGVYEHHRNSMLNILGIMKFIDKHGGVQKLSNENELQKAMVQETVNHVGQDVEKELKNVEKKVKKELKRIKKKWKL